MLRGKPVTNLQVLVSIADTGEERGALEKDGDLVRLKRNAICCLSGKPVILHRTGDLSSMGKYLRWEKGTIVFTVVRLLKEMNGVPHLAIKGSWKFTDSASAQVFNSYFARYCDLTATVCAQEPLSMDNSWTPKRRRKELINDGDSQSEVTPISFTSTPIKYSTP